MRIFKNLSYQDAIKCLVGEMFNIEMSKKIFELGKVLPNDQWQNGYPNLDINGITYEIKAASGYIFVTNTVDLKKIKRDILEKINSYEKKYQSILENNLMDYHTFSQKICTNIKIKNYQKLTKINASSNTCNIKRHIVDNDFIRSNLSKTVDINYAESARFVWKVDFIDKIRFREKPNEIINIFVNSIFYDESDISVYDNNQIDFDFDFTKLRGYENIITKADANILKVSHYGNPAGLELMSPRIVYRDYNSFVKNPKIFKELKFKNKLYHLDISDIYSDDSILNLENLFICNFCHSELYDENYVLYYDDLTAKVNEKYVLVCVYCAHIKDLSYYFGHCKYIFRVKFPRNIHDRINESKFVKDKKNALHKLAEHQFSYQITLNNYHYFLLF